MGNTIAAVLIMKNEEKVIGRCIKSLLGMDEIVILDTGSTDKSVEIARSLGAKVFTRSSEIVPFHFAQARNEAMCLASSEWVLSIDADEVLRPGCVRKMKRGIEEGANANAFLVTFTNNAGPGSSKSTVIQKVKLFKAAEYEWKYRVHEQPLPTNPEKRKVGDLSAVVIEHIPEPDKSKRHGQNIELLKMCVKESPEYTRAFRHLGQELMLKKEWREAIPLLAHYAEKTEEGPLHKSEAIMHIGRCYSESAELDTGLKWFEQAFLVDPRRREPLYHATRYLIQACRLEEAEMMAKMMMDVPLATRPQSTVDLDVAWDGTPLKMYMFCKTEIARAKAAYEAQKASS